MADKKELGEMTQEELTKELEGARGQLKKVNAESADRRKKLETLEQEKKDLADKNLSETEKLTAKMAANEADLKGLKDQLSTERVHTAVISKATKLGFANPEDAYSLIDLSQVETTDGKVSGFTESLEALAKSGRLVMADEKDRRQSDGLGTPLGKGKPAKKGTEQVPIKIRV